MLNRILLVSCLLVASSSMAGTYRPFESATGAVVHNIASSSTFALDAGQLGECEAINTGTIRCQLADASATVGPKTVSLTSVSYMEPDQFSDHHSYYFRGIVSLAEGDSHQRNVTFVILENKDTGIRRGYLSVVDLGMTEQIVVD